MPQPIIFFGWKARLANERFGHRTGQCRLKFVFNGHKATPEDLLWLRGRRNNLASAFRRPTLLHGKVHCVRTREFLAYICRVRDTIGMTTYTVNVIKFEN